MYIGVYHGDTMSFTYQAEQWLPQPIDTVFAFFSNPDNLPRLMPPWQKARVESASIVPAPGATFKAAGAGSRVTLSFRPIPFSPIRLRWVAEISEFAWNDHFCDRQLSGPFASWTHCHRLRSVDREGINVTLIVDQVEYDLPGGALGRLAHRLFVHRQIERTFAFRQAEISKIFHTSRPS